MLDGEKLQVKYLLLSLLLFICKSSCPPIYLLAGIQTVPSTDRCLPSYASMGLEIDLIMIQKHAFDLTFVRQMQPHDNMFERVE